MIWMLGQLYPKQALVYMSPINLYKQLICRKKPKFYLNFVGWLATGAILNK